MMTKAMEVKGAFCILQRLDVSRCELTRPDGEALGRAISAKVFPKLKELRCGWNGRMGDEGWLAILKGLEEGGCKELQLLTIEYNMASGNMATALIHALSSDHCRRLEEIFLDHCFEDTESIRLILQSIKDLTFPYLRKFDAWGSRLWKTQDYSIWLSEVLKAGAFPKLEEQQFTGQSIHQSLWEALESGSCPGLRKLELNGVALDSDSSTALVSAFASGALWKLQEFHFSGSDRDDGDTNLVEVLAILGSSCPDLRCLDLAGGFLNPATR